MTARRLPDPGDDRGSLPMLLLVIVMGVALGGLMLPMVIVQATATRFDDSRVLALDAAQAGIDVAVGRFRAALDPSGSIDPSGNPYGDAGGLPCATAGAPLTGSANGTGPARYSVTVDYFTTDPVANPGAIAMVCAPGYGPYDKTLNTRTPKYARITSTGTDGPAANGSSAGRTLVTYYVFKTDDTNVSGGVIRIFPDSTGNQFCLDAGSGSPAAGTQLLMQPCSTANPPAAQQLFSYRADLTIQLVSTGSKTSPGLCIDSTTPHTAGTPIFLAACAASGQPVPYDQMWSVDDNAHLRGTASDKSNTDGYCITAPTPHAGGQAITLQACAGGVTDQNQTWVPSPSAGAGAAGAPNGNLVNFAAFGQCLDVTGQNPASPYLILYTCKQNPNKANLTWNQLFTASPSLPANGAPATVQWRTYDTANQTTYCLASPGVAGQYVTLTTNCSGPATQWTVYRTLDATGNALTYNLKYTIHDSGGYCLSPGPSNDLHNGVYLKVVVAACDSSTGQKWNADPSLSKPMLQNTFEK